MNVRLAPLFLMLATPAIAQSDENVAAFASAIEDAGCIMTAENEDAIRMQAGLTEQELTDVVGMLYISGIVAIRGDGAKQLVDEFCNP